MGSPEADPKTWVKGSSFTWEVPSWAVGGDTEKGRQPGEAHHHAAEASGAEPQG